MRKAVRAIIIAENKLAVLHRNKFGEEYDTLPGGNISFGETPEQALFREVSEETSLKFSEPKLVFVEHAGDPYGDQYIYLCKYESGELQLAPNAEEHAINALGKNLYEPRWVDLKDLPNMPFLSIKLRDKILEYASTGWPTQVVEITTN